MKRIWTCLALLIFAVVLAVSASAATRTISNVTEFMTFMNTPAQWGDDVTLAADINLAGKTQKPIGNATTAFTGTFDGDGHTISGISITGAGKVGLFGVVNGATIENVTISGTVKTSANYAAGLVAFVDTSATIRNCTNSCTVSMTTTSGTATGVAGIVGYADNAKLTQLIVSGCTNTGAITAYRNMGGIAGYTNPLAAGTVLIEKCTNTGAVTATCTGNSSNTGGILGVINANKGTVTITKCYNRGAVKGYYYLGGIIGHFAGADTSMTSAKYQVTECWNAGAITSTRAKPDRAHTGGIIGHIHKVGLITDCLNTGVVTGKYESIGGLFGDSAANSYVGAVNCLNKARVVDESGTYNGYTNSIGGYMSTKPAGICYYMGERQGQTYTNAGGTLVTVQYAESKFATLNANGTWLAAADPELKYFHKHDTEHCVDNGDGTHTYICPCGDASTEGETEQHSYGDTGICACGAVIDLSVITTANQLLILMNAETLWQGGEYSLGANINLASYSGTLSQRPIGDATTPFTGSFDGGEYTISGLSLNVSGNNVGLFGAVGADTTIKNLTVSGSVKGQKYVGGIVGIVGSTSSGKNVTIENCHNLCTVEGTGQTGGVVGYFHGKSYTEALIKNCTNGGTVTCSGDDVGGIAGIFWEVSGEKLTNSAAISSGTNKAGGIVGRATGNLNLSELNNTGKVTTTRGYAGGIIGQLMNTPSCDLSKSTNSGAVNGTSAVGGIVGSLQLRQTGDDKAIVQTCKNSGTVTGSGDNVGGIIGVLHGSNVDSPFTTAVGTDNALTLSKNENTASVTGGRYVGGIIGAFRGADTKNETATFILSECANSGAVQAKTETAVSGTGADCGGVAGLLLAVGGVNNCRNTGNVSGAVQYLGGFVGRTVTYVNIANCYADCTVTCTNAEASYVRAFCGYPSAKKMNNCFFNADKCDNEATNESEFNAAGGSTPKPYTRAVFDTLNGDGKWVAMTSPELLVFHTMHDNVQGGIDNGDGTHTHICPCGDESTTGETVAHTYDETGYCFCGNTVELDAEISTADQLITLMRYSNLWDGDYVLTANINLSGKVQKTIGNTATPFTGTFDGNGKTISGLNISTAEYAGLFGVAQNAEIRNLTVSGTVKGTGYYAGGIVAYAGVRNGTENTFVIENCVNKASVTGGRYVGGIVGYYVGSDTAANGKTDSVITNCYNSGAVKATSTEEVNDVGGIAGILWNIGDANNLYATGKVTGSNSNAGGIVGRMTGYVYIKNCYANAVVVGATSGISYIRAFCGKPDATEGIVACYYNPDKTLNEEAAIGWRVYTEADFDSLNRDGIWLNMGTAAELVIAHTKHNNKLAWTDLGAAGHAPICPCGAESSIGATVAHTYDANFICTACGNADSCTHIHTEMYVDGTPNCQTSVFTWERCANCFTQLGEATEIPADAKYHVFAWSVADGEAVCACTVCSEVKADAQAPETFTELYVSSAGTGIGGFSKDAPLNDFDTAMQLAATQEEAVTIYILDQATVPFPSEVLSYYTYLEPRHENTITISGANGSSGILRFSADDQKMLYGLNGPTTFENVEISLGGTDAYLYLVARHNPLVLGEGISADFQRVSGSASHSGNLYVIGGCYENYFAACGEDKSTDVTVCSGTYRTIIGGNYSGNACGTASNISLKLLGDITTRQQICAGNVGTACGNIEITIDGNLSVGTFFSFGSQTSGKKAAKTTVLVQGGSVVLSSFFANPSSAISVHAIGSVDTAHNVLHYTQELVVYANESNASAVALRNSIFASVFSGSNLAEDFASKVFFLWMGEEGYCTETGSTHTPDGDPATVESTCTVQGSSTYHCSACNEDYTVALPLAEHTYNDADAVTIPATCIAPEMEKNICSVCHAPKHTVVGGEYGEHTEPVGGFCQLCNKDLSADCVHENATATQIIVGCGSGTKWYCPDCDKTEVDLVSDGHNYGKYTVTVEPTATMAGVKSRTCKTCGKVENALLYASDSLNAEAIATDANGGLADFAIASSKLTKAEKAALNALLQQEAYGSEVKVSYETDGSAITGITYNIPVPVEYTEYENVKVVVKDEDGKIHFVDFRIEKGYIVFSF